MSKLVLITNLLLLAATPSAPRPKWVDDPPVLNGGVYETTVIVGPEATKADCEAKLGPLVEQAARQYVAKEYGGVPEEIFDLRFTTLKDRVVGEKWDEQVNAGSGQSTFLHVRLKFDDALRAMWRHKSDRWTTESRTAGVLQGFGIGIGALLAVHLGLRFTPSFKMHS